MIEQLQSALETSFNLQTLQRMVRYKLGVDLYDYAAPGSKPQVIFELLDAAKREGFLEKLIVGARAYNPGNEKLRDFARQYGLESTRKSSPELERIIEASHPNLPPEEFRQRVFEAEMRVCRIEISVPGGNIYGTGFLVRADLVITNYHVVQVAIENPALARAIQLRFDYKATQAKVVDEGILCNLASKWLVDSSEPGPVDEPRADQLDYAILRLEGPVARMGDFERGYYAISSAPPTFARDGALFIMQHPRGRPLEFAMDTRAIIGTNMSGTRVRYRTNTEPGSSGSPCLSPDFALLALHHSGDPDFDPSHKPEYNQGVPIDLIAKLLKDRGHGAVLGIN